MGTRRKPTARSCPWCAGPGKQIKTLWQVGRADQSVVYLLHFHWPEGVVRDRDWLTFPDGRKVRFQADHYSGSTCDFPRRLAEHLSGQGAKLVAAAIALGVEVRVARVWHVPLAFEQQLRSKPSDSPRSANGLRFGAATSLRPLCPEPACSGEKAWRRFPEAKVRAHYQQLREQAEAKRQARRAWNAHCDQLEADGVWDAYLEWDVAYPHLAYGTAATALTASPGEDRHAPR